MWFVFDRMLERKQEEHTNHFDALMLYKWHHMSFYLNLFMKKLLTVDSIKLIE